MPQPALPLALLSKIEDAIRSIRFGTVQITIHNAQVVQIEKIEKIRVTQTADLAPGGSPNTCSGTNRVCGGSPS